MQLPQTKQASSLCVPSNRDFRTEIDTKPENRAGNQHPYDDAHPPEKPVSVFFFFLSFIPRWSQRLTGMGNGPSTRKCCAVKDSCGAGREVDVSAVCQKRGGKELVFQTDYQLNICL